jgi:hypothetical protein
MWQEALVALAVIASGLWVGWSMVLPGRIRKSMLARLGRKPAKGCDCGEN